MMTLIFMMAEQQGMMSVRVATLKASCKSMTNEYAEYAMQCTTT